MLMLIQQPNNEHLSLPCQYKTKMVRDLIFLSHGKEL